MRLNLLQRYSTLFYIFLVAIFTLTQLLHPDSLIAESLSPRHGSCYKIYVSPQGDDLAGGETPAKSLGSPAAAVDLLRKMRKEGAMNNDICIEFSKGTYYLKHPIMLDAQTSGEGQTRTILEATSGLAIFSGGVRLPPPQQLPNGHQLFDLHGICPTLGQHALFIDGERRGRSRTPKSGYFTVAGEIPRSVEGGQPRDGFEYADTLDPSKYNINPFSEVIGLHYWSSSRFPIYSINEEKRTIVVDGLTSHSDVWARFAKSENYFFENIDRHNIAPGEWFHNGSSAEYTPLDNPTSQSVKSIEAIFPCTPTLLNIDFGAHDISIVGIAFEHTGEEEQKLRVTPAQAGIGPGVGSAIKVGRATRVVFDGIRIEHTAGFGIQLSRASWCPTIKSSILSDLGGGGVIVGDPVFAYRPQSLNSENALTCGATVRESIISNGGIISLGAAAIWIGDVDRNSIVDNNINNFRYTGISLGWNWGGFRRSSHNIISGNRIADIGLGVLSDLGGIYTLSDLDGSIIENNHITNVKAATYGGFGIYLDRDSTGLTVQNNFVEDTNDAGIAMHMTNNNTVRNNRVCINSALPIIKIIKPGSASNTIENNGCPNRPAVNP